MGAGLFFEFNIGGYGVEIIGKSASPFGRIGHSPAKYENTNPVSMITGIWNNIGWGWDTTYIDNSTNPSMGIVIEDNTSQSSPTFKVKYLPANTPSYQANWQDIWTLNPVTQTCTLFGQSINSGSQSSTGITGVTWSVVSNPTQPMLASNGYIIANVSGTVLTLPTFAAVGTELEVAGYLGNWTITQSSTQQIVFGKHSTTFGTLGSLSSSYQTDSLRMVCVVNSSIWLVLSSLGQISIN